MFKSLIPFGTTQVKMPRTGRRNCAQSFFPSSEKQRLGLTKALDDALDPGLLLPIVQYHSSRQKEFLSYS